MIKNKIIHSIAIASAILFMTGCVTQPKPLYVYGDYSTHYYHSKKEPSPESTLELQKAIQNAIQNVNGSSSGRVAPGMYANLGYMYLKAGKNDEAVVNFQKEKSTYSESAHFMNRMIQKVKVLQGETDD